MKAGSSNSAPSHSRLNCSPARNEESLRSKGLRETSQEPEGPVKTQRGMGGVAFKKSSKLNTSLPKTVLPFAAPAEFGQKEAVVSVSGLPSNEALRKKPQ